MLCIRSIPILFSTVLFLGILDTSIASASPDNFFLNFDKDIRRSVLERRNRKIHRNGERVEAKEAVNNVLDEELQQGLFIHPLERYAKAVLVSTRHKLNEQYHRAFDDDAMTDISTTERKVRRKMKETRSKEDIELEKSAKMFEAYIEFDLE